jgi:aspartate/methionine/tyrosine aminotransferase
LRTSEGVQGFTDSDIRQMARVGSQHVGVNLAQGMPNFALIQPVIDAAHRALDGDLPQHAIHRGAPSLRRAIADKDRTFYAMGVDPQCHATMCRGSTETM